MMPFLQKLNLRYPVLVGIFFASAVSLSAQTASDSTAAVAGVTALLQTQSAAWNAGDVERFMDGYERSDSIRFVSGGTVRRGWKTLLDRYKTAYPTKAAMGTLRFGDLEITLLSPTSALVLGRWELRRDNDKPGGLFTLVFRKTAQGWKIIYDHTSSQ